MIFRKRKIRGQIYEKNHERINFPQNPSFENFEAMIKIAWSGHSPFKREKRKNKEEEEEKEGENEKKKEEKTIDI